MSLQCHLKVLSKTQHISYCIHIILIMILIVTEFGKMHSSHLILLIWRSVKPPGMLSRFKTFKDDKGVVILQFL